MQTLTSITAMERALMCTTVPLMAGWIANTPRLPISRSRRAAHRLATTQSPTRRIQTRLTQSRRGLPTQAILHWLAVNIIRLITPIQALNAKSCVQDFNVCFIFVKFLSEYFEVLQYKKRECFWYLVVC